MHLRSPCSSRLCISRPYCTIAFHYSLYSMTWQCLIWLFKLHKKWMETILKPYAISQDIWLLETGQLLIFHCFKSQYICTKNYKVSVPIAQFCASRYYQRTGYLAICNNLTDITDPCQAHKSPNCPTINVLAFAKTPMLYFSIFSPQKKSFYVQTTVQHSEQSMHYKVSCVLRPVNKPTMWVKMF